jgi:hypothetical protein
MNPVADWFRARLHAALDRALDAYQGEVRYGIEGEAPETFWIEVPTQLSDEQLDAAMDAVVRLGPDGEPVR